MLRIAYICTDPGVPVFGSKGCSVHVQEGLRALTGQGAEITLFAQRLGDPPPADLASIPVHKLPRLSKASTWHREVDALIANNTLQAYLEREGPFNMVYERYALWNYAGMRFAREAGIPGVLEVNAPLIEEQRTHRTLIHEQEAKNIATQTFADASVLVAVSDNVAQYIRTFEGTADRIQVIPNGVDADRFSPNQPATCPGPRDSFTVGFVGSLKPWHGLNGLVEAFAILHSFAPEARLLIVGDGPERKSIEQELATRSLLDATHFTGAVPPEDVPGLVASMDVGVAPYPQLENCYFSPLKAFEYMAAGLPVVASRIGQLDKLIAHDQSGILYPPEDTVALAEALIRLADDIPLRSRLGMAARAAILNGHTWDAVGARILGHAGLSPVTA